MGELFDRFVAVDWSAAARPVTGRDSIWIAVLDDRAGAVPMLTNPSTRRRAERRLAELVGGRERTLLVVDASLGYPAGSADWFGLGGAAPWRAMWGHVAAELVDDERNANDRFRVAAELNRRGGGTGPFWGRPAALRISGLDPTKPPSFPVPELRRTERRLADGGRRPASCWQLLGAGSVGSQTLTLLPVLERLVARRAATVWPFTTGLRRPATPSGSFVVAETWPTAFDLDLSVHAVRDAAQVAGVVARLRLADATGELSSWFDVDLTGADRASVESEEGWVLSPAAGGPMG